MKKAPTASMATPVHRLMLMPAALSISACESLMPTMVRITP